MSVVEFKNYKSFVRDWMEKQPGHGRGQFQKFSKYLKVHPTLISHIFNGDKDLTLEQGTLLAQYLGLSNLETDYFLLLVQHARAGSVELRKIIDRQLNELQKRSRNLINRVHHDGKLSDPDKAIFYSNWYYSGIRLLTDIPAFQTKEALQAYVNLPKELVERVLEFLVLKGLCKFDGQKYSLGPALTHLESTSDSLPRHHTNWRMKAIARHDKLSDRELVFTGPLVISKKDADVVRERLIQVISEVGKIAKDSGSEELRCFNLDWIEIPQG